MTDHTRPLRVGFPAASHSKSSMLVSSAEGSTANPELSLPRIEQEIDSSDSGHQKSAWQAPFATTASTLSSAIPLVSNWTPLIRQRWSDNDNSYSSLDASRITHRKEPVKEKAGPAISESSTSPIQSLHLQTPSSAGPSTRYSAPGTKQSRTKADTQSTPPTVSGQQALALVQENITPLIQNHRRSSQLAHQNS